MTDAPDDTAKKLPAKSEAEKQRDKMGVLIAEVQKRGPELKTLLRESGIDFDRFVEVFRRALIKGQDNPNTNLLLADAASVIRACIDACTAGVLPDGKKGAIVIYNTNVAGRGEPKRWQKRAQFLVMYEGMLQIAYASGNFTSIMAHVVYEVDEWDYGLGIDPWIKHKPGTRPPRPDGAPEYAIVAAYAVAKTTNGGVFVEVFEPEDIRKVMAVSKAASGPAKDWREQMVRKGPLRRMWKFLPRDPRMDRILEADEENYDIETPEPEPERKLTPGFAQKALPQGADPVMPEIEDEEDFVPVSPERVVTEGPAVMHMDPTGTFGTPDLDDLPPSAEDEVPLAPWAADFKAALETAKKWPGVKPLLKAFAAGPMWDLPGVQDWVLTEAWRHYREMDDRTDFVTDAWLFACWLAGGAGDPDSVEANWRIMEGAEVYAKAEEPLQKLLVSLYAAVMNGGDGS